MIKSNHDLLPALVTGGSLSQTRAGETAEIRAETIWLSDYEAALKEAKSGNKLVAIDFFATWNGPCRMMERNTFPDEGVQQRLVEFVPLRIDVDQQPELAGQYGVEVMPMTLVVDAAGKPLAGAVGYLEVADYLAVLDQAKACVSEPKIGGQKP